MSRTSLRSEAGLTLIEVAVAAFCLALITAAASALFASGSNSSLASQRQAQEINIADQQIEQIRQEVATGNNFSALAMQSAPAAAVSPIPTVNGGAVTTDPNQFVSGSCFRIESNWDSTPTAATPAIGGTSWPGCVTGAEPLVIGGGASLIPATQTVSVGSATATVYTYVTATNVGCNAVLVGASGCYSPDSSCTVSGATQSGNCWSYYNSATQSADAKRVTVAVRMNNGGANNTGSGANLRIGQNSPEYVSTIFTNPVPSNQANNSIGLTLGVNIG